MWDCCFGWLRCVGLSEVMCEMGDVGRLGLR